MKLVPYCLIDGVRNIADSKIMGMYDRMVSDGTADYVFEDGEIRNREGFLESMKSTCSLYILLSDTSEVLAIAWLNRFEGRTARFHFCAFKTAWGGNTVYMGQFICREILAYTYNDGSYIFDTLIGRIPSNNSIGVAYLKRLGAHFLGEIPKGHWNEKKKKSESCHVIYMNREILDNGENIH